MKSNTEMMVGQSKCHHGSSTVTQFIKTKAKRSYRRRAKQVLNQALLEKELDTPVIDPTSYGYID